MKQLNAVNVLKKWRNINMDTEQEDMERALGEALYQNIYTQRDAEQRAKQYKLRWLQVLQHASECYHDCEVREK